MVQEKIKTLKKMLRVWRKCIHSYDQIVLITVKSLEDCYKASEVGEEEEIYEELKKFYKSCYDKMIKHREILMETEKCMASTIAAVVNENLANEMFSLINSKPDYAGLDENLGNLDTLDDKEVLKRSQFTHDIYISHLNLISDKIEHCILKHKKEIEA